MTSTANPALSVVKYDPSSTTVLECGADFGEGAALYIDSNGKWQKALATGSLLMTHVALTDGSATPTGEGNDTTKYATGFTRGQIEVSTAWSSSLGKRAWLSDTAGEYSNAYGTQPQMIGTIVNKGGTIIEINIPSDKTATTII